MRLVILTTETLHHAFFVRELAKNYPDVMVMEETNVLHAPFPTEHPFERDRDAHERDAWFAGRSALLTDFAEVRCFATINGADAVAALANSACELVIVVGTGKLQPEVIAAVPSRRLLNLHGGDPEQYRGLDTHMWAIYHGDFSGLVTTLHMVAPEVDTGDVIASLPVPLRHRMRLPELRRANTEVALRLTMDAIDELGARGCIGAQPQQRKGRYYSFMPTVLKDICLSRFNRHCERLA
jgi:methionyl-tRNA formyltransferase